jgi:hypothetical protein
VYASSKTIEPGGSEVLTAVRAKMAVFGFVATCTLVRVTKVSDVLTASIIKAIGHFARTDETANSHPSTWCYNPEGSHRRFGDYEKQLTIGT